MDLFDFRQTADQTTWRSLDDWVMGGKSTSRIQFCSSGGRFSGHIAPTRNCGFASIHSPELSMDLKPYEGIQLDIYGDVKLYHFILRDDNPQQLRYEVLFETTANTRQTITLPFNQFVPMVMGTQVEFAPSLNLQKITAMGLMIANEQFGDFNLHITAIRTYAPTLIPQAI